MSEPTTHKVSVELSPETQAYYAGVSAGMTTLDRLTAMPEFQFLDFTQQVAAVVFYATANSTEHTDTQEKADQFLQGLMLRMPKQPGFMVEMNTDGDAFGDYENKDYYDAEYDGRMEVCRILKRIVRDLEDAITEGKCMDVNGNTVGKWSLSSD